MCTDTQHQETLTRLMAIERVLTQSGPDTQNVAVSDINSFVCDFKGRNYLYMWSSQALTLSAGGFYGTFTIPAGEWYQLAFRDGTQVTTSGYGVAATQVMLLATNSPLDALSLIANAGTNLNTSLLAREAGGNLALAASILNSFAVTSNGRQVITQAVSNASVPTGAGNTIIKASEGAITSIVVTTTGTGAGNVLLYDNATTNAGTVLAVIPANATAGTQFQVNGWFANGLVAQNVLSGPVFTVFYS